MRPNIVFLGEKPEFKEVLEAINATKKDKAPGMCGIPCRNLKTWRGETRLWPVQLVLQIWETEETLQNWKDAGFVPPFKKESVKDCGNYRGISLLPVPRKILILDSDFKKDKIRIPMSVRIKSEC